MRGGISRRPSIAIAGLPLRSARRATSSRARMQRWREIENSLALPDGKCWTTPAAVLSMRRSARLPPNALVLSLVEGWRGEIVHLAVTDAAGRLRALQDRRSVVPQLVRRWLLRCAASRSRISRSATRASTCPIADMTCRADRMLMFKTLLARARQGYRTAAFPAEEPSMPPLFRGRPELDRNSDPAAFAAICRAVPDRRHQRIARADRSSISGAASFAGSASPKHARRDASTSPGIGGWPRHDATS